MRGFVYFFLVSHLARVANGRDSQMDRVGEALVWLINVLWRVPRDRYAEFGVEGARGRAEIPRTCRAKPKARPRLQHGPDAGLTEFLLHHGPHVVPAEQTDGSLVAPAELRRAGKVVMVRDDGANGCPTEVVDVRAGTHDFAGEVARHRVEAGELRMPSVDVVKYVVCTEAQGTVADVLQVDHDVEPAI